MTRQSCGSHKLNEITILPLSFSFQVLKTTKTCFHFPSPTSIFFLIFESWKQWSKTKPNKWSSVGPTQFGWWIMKTEWYYLVFIPSKQALNYLYAQNTHFTMLTKQYPYAKSPRKVEWKDILVHHYHPQLWSIINYLQQHHLSTEKYSNWSQISTSKATIGSFLKFISSLGLQYVMERDR